MSPKLLLSIALCLLCLLAPMTYTPQGSWAELIILSVIVFISIYTCWSLFYSRTLAQSSRARRAQFPFDSLFTPALWGAWISVLGALVSLMPMSTFQLSMIAPQAAQDWLEFKDSLYSISQFSKGIELNYFPLSLSPAHSWHWLVLQLNWIILIYLAGLVRGFRRPLLFGLAFIGPLLALVACIHTLGDANLLYFKIQSADRVQLSGFITALINPNHAASLLMLSGFVSLGLAEETNQGLDQDSTDKKLSMLFYLSASFSSIALPFTSSRAAILIYMMMLGFWYSRNQLSWVNFRRSLLACVMSLGILFPLCIMLLAKSGWWDNQEMIKGQSWVDSLLIVAQYFPWGSGRESFGEIFTHYQSVKTMNWVSHPENQIIRTIVEAGFIGLLSMLYYSWSWWKWWTLESIQNHPLALSLGLGVTALTLHQGFDFGVESLGVMVPLACAWGLMWSYQSAQNIFGTKTTKYKKRSSAWNRSLKQTIVMSLLLLVGLLINCFKVSPIRQVIEHYDESLNTGELINKSLEHPLSAHIAVRFAHSQNLSMNERLVWVKRSKSLAPQWSSPLILEARLFHQSGFDQMAALNYRSVLSRFPEQRDLIFQDLFRSSLAYPYEKWLPEKDWYSFYSQYRNINQQAANQFLRALDSKVVSQNLNLRSLYIRYIIPSCHDQDQQAVRNLIPHYTIQLKEHELNEQLKKSKAHCLLKQELITYRASQAMCIAQKREKKSFIQPIQKLYESLKKEICYKQSEKELDLRAEKSFFSLRKILKTR